MTLLLDTGPLVAAIDRSDKHHARCTALLESASGPLLIPTTVIVEVCWLLEERPDIEAAFLTSVATGEFQHVTIAAADLARIAELVRAYADMPLGAVDASVIAIAERLQLTDVATFDRRHFTVVRPKHTTALNLLPQPDKTGGLPYAPRSATSNLTGRIRRSAWQAQDSGSYVCVAGTAPIAEGGGVAAPGDVYAQSVRCLDIAEQALQEAGASVADVVRTRVMLTDIGQWRDAARAHAQRFAQVRPACTFVEVSRFIDPGWLVEFELDAIILDQPTIRLAQANPREGTQRRLARPELLIEVDAIAVK